VWFIGGIMPNPVKFSEDVVPLGDMKVKPGRIVRRLDETRRPVLLTSHGRGVAVVQTLSDFEAAQEERDFMKAVVVGLSDIEAGRVSSLEEVKRSLGLD
jgi:prevent-host-death family protein